MGLSSSQARLLHLTGRMHQIEYKAQRLEAQKLQLANESSRVYEEYENALDASKIQYGALNADGTTTFLDATLNALENGVVSDYEGSVSGISYLLCDDKHIYVTPAFAAANGISEGDTGIGDTTLDQYLTEHNCPTKPTGHYEQVTDYSNRISVTALNNSVQAGSTTAEKWELTGGDLKNVTAGSAALTGYVPSSTNPVANVTVNPYVAGTTLTSAGTAPSVTGQTLQQYADGTIASNVKYDEVPSGYQQVNISTQAQYNQLVNEIKNGRQTSDMYVKLDGNIMVDQSISKFEGIFDGNGYSITMKDYGSDLFTNLDSATVQNLKVNNGSLASTATNSEIYGVSTSSGGQYYDSVKGGLIDTATNCKIVNCNTVGAIQGASTVSANIGGLIGEDNGSTIYSSSARVELNVYATSGGNYGLLVGRANGTKLYNTTASAAINVHESSGPTSSNYNLFGFSNGVTNNTLATTPLTSYTLTGSDEQIKQYLAYEYANGNSETYNTNLTKMSSLNTSRLASMLNSYQSKGKSTYATLDDLIKEGLLIPIAAKKSCTYSVSEGASETRGSVDINYDKDSTAKYIAYTAANKSGNTTNYETFYNVIKGYSD